MFTDMVGFTSLTQANEAAALTLLERHNQILRPIFPRFQGREVKTIGDSFLVEFDSALDATRCAVEIQRSLRDHNEATGEDQRIRLRIGIHLGDVVHSGEDVFGDAVNVASRIEPLADPEGICVSQQVFDQLRNKFEAPLEKLPAPSLKNVRFATDVYRVVLPWEPVASAGPGVEPAATRRLAVLPFANLSPDPQDEYFADGLAEEMMTELSKLRGLGVIARTSVMRYKNTTKSVLEIGKELRVDQILEGSVRKAAQRIRITAQLIDARSEEHLWADRFDRDLTDIFAVQSEIARSVAQTLDLKFGAPERSAAPPTRDVEAYTLYLQARHLWNYRSVGKVREAMEKLQEAIARDPGFAQAHAGLADCHAVLFDLWGASHTEALPPALAAANEALRLDPTIAEAHASLGLVQTARRNYREAEEEYRRAIDLNPGYSMAHHWYALLLAGEGRREEADREASLSEAADPLSPTILLNQGFRLWVAGKGEEALRKWERALEIEPGHQWLYTALFSYFVATSQPERAREKLRTYTSLPVPSAQQEGRWLVLALGHIAAGDRTAARDHLARLEKAAASEPRLAYPVFMIYATLGELDAAFDWLFRDLESGGNGRPWTTRANPVWEALRADPRFSDYLQRCGLASERGPLHPA